MIAFVETLMLLVFAAFFHPENGQSQIWSIHLKDVPTADTLEIDFKEDSPNNFTVSEFFRHEPKYLARAHYLYSDQKGFQWLETLSSCDSMSISNKQYCVVIDSLPKSMVSFTLFGNLENQFSSLNASGSDDNVCSSISSTTNTTRQLCTVVYDTVYSVSGVSISDVHAWGYGGGYFGGGGGNYDTVVYNQYHESVSVRFGTYASGPLFWSSASGSTDELVRADRIDKNCLSVRIRQSAQPMNAQSLLFSSRESARNWCGDASSRKCVIFAPQGLVNRDSRRNEVVFVTTDKGVYRALILRR